MRKILLAALALTASLPMTAQAQSAREIRHDQREVNRDLRRGDYQEAREDQQELREDWRDYRKSHRDVFRGGAYRGPRGYTYRPVVTGYRFAPSYYSSRYAINPGTYRLPRAGVNRRWIRYGNDVALVNVRNGRVITVYRDFFW